MSEKAVSRAIRGHFKFLVESALLTRFTEAVLPRKSDHGDDDVFETTGPSRKMRRHNALLSV